MVWPQPQNLIYSVVGRRKKMGALTSESGKRHVWTCLSASPTSHWLELSHIVLSNYRECWEIQSSWVFKRKRHDLMENWSGPGILFSVFISYSQSTGKALTRPHLYLTLESLQYTLVPDKTATSIPDGGKNVNTGNISLWPHFFWTKSPSNLSLHCHLLI
jgi:hypothetical protein